MHFDVIMANHAVDALLWSLNIQEGAATIAIFLAGGRLGPGRLKIYCYIVRVIYREPLAPVQGCIDFLLEPAHHAVEVGPSGVHLLRVAQLVCPSPKHLILLVLEADSMPPEEGGEVFSGN